MILIGARESAHVVIAANADCRIDSKLGENVAALGLKLWILALDHAGNEFIIDPGRRFELIGWLALLALDEELLADYG